MGDDVNYRFVLLAALPLALAACSSDTQIAHYGAASALAAPLAAVETSALAPAQPPKKTLSDRVLAAIALERVTGLKPDPSRLVE